MSENTIIITAGGSGQRMKAEIPKQFIPVHEKPLLMWAIEAFFAYKSDIKIMLVIPENHVDLWNDLCREFDFNISHQIVYGGDNRFQSVKNAVELINEDGLTGVHDGVRPFPSLNTIGQAFNDAGKFGSAVPFVDSTDSLRFVDKQNSKIINRDKVKRIQTPQVFQTEILKKAYQQPYNEGFTDDASVVEHLGHDIHLFEGNMENIKVTTPMDLRLVISLAEMFH
ncbi:MAG: 2-C-methyl-D-erythritol 4-phosphate cytidylyltransferase [Bacteroidales bacterium]